MGKEAISLIEFLFENIPLLIVIFGAIFSMLSKEKHGHFDQTGSSAAGRRILGTAEKKSV